MQGYCGKILRVSLSDKEVKIEPLNNKMMDTFIGGKGFGAKMLYEEVKPGIDPLGPENKLMIATGPFTGTAAPTANRYGVYFKSPLTGLFGESYSGGFFAPEMKRAGYDIIAVEGKSRSPVYLQIRDDSVELVGAQHLCGLDTRDTEEAIRKEMGDERIQVACIGPGGENLVRFACICNGWRQAGRCGAGAVMGSKKLKAIAIRGSRKVEVANKNGLISLTKEIVRRIPKDLGLTRYGTPTMVNMENELGTFPTRYWHKGSFDASDKINAETMAKEIVSEHRGCWGCTIRCGKLSVITEGKYAGTMVEGPDYETINAFGGLCEIGDIKAIAKANELCDRVGIDTMTTGNVIALAMDAYEAGRLKTDFPIKFGDPNIVLSLIEKIAMRKGIGQVLAEGVKKAAEELDLEDLAIHVKGLEPPGYDPRGLKGAGLSYVTSTRGGCHNRASVYALESRGQVDRFAVEGKAGLVVDWEEKLALLDSLIICNFMRGRVSWEELVKLYEAVTGRIKSEEVLRVAAQRMINLARSFNVREGISKKDDVLPKRFMEEPFSEGNSAGIVISQDELEKMLTEYYSLRGWDEQGIPKQKVAD